MPRILHAPEARQALTPAPLYLMKAVAALVVFRFSVITFGETVCGTVTTGVAIGLFGVSFRIGATYLFVDLTAKVTDGLGAE